MRISDWSSDVISSDLLPEVNQPLAPRLLHEAVRALPDRLLAVALLRCHHNFRCFTSAHRLPLIPKNKRYMGQGKKAWHPRRDALTQKGILHRRIPCSLLRTKQPGSPYAFSPRINRDAVRRHKKHLTPAKEVQVRANCAAKG